MELVELIKRRESCREYEERKVPKEKLTAIIEAARLSPSACNSQPWRFIVVDEEGKVRELARYVYDPETGINHFALKAPAFIVLLETPAKLHPALEKKLGSQYFAGIDVGSAAAYMTLAAVEEGLATCIMGWFSDEDAMMKLLGIPKEMKIQLILSVGYPKEPPAREKKRRDMQDILSFNQY